MVDPDVKSFICFAARRNSMKLMIACVIPIQVRVRAKSRGYIKHCSSLITHHPAAYSWLMSDHCIETAK